MVRKRIKQLSILSLILGFIGMGQIEFMIIDMAYKLFNVSLPLIPLPITAILALILGIKCKRKIKELGISNETIEKDNTRAGIGIILGALGAVRFLGYIYMIIF